MSTNSRTINSPIQNINPFKVEAMKAAQSQLIYGSHKLECSNCVFFAVTSINCVADTSVYRSGWRKSGYLVPQYKQAGRQHLHVELT